MNFKASILTKSTTLFDRFSNWGFCRRFWWIGCHIKLLPALYPITSLQR